MEQLPGAADEHRQHLHAGADGDHGGAALGLHMLALLYPRALRKDQQADAVLQALDGGLDGADVAVAPIHGEGAHIPDEAAHDGDAEQLLLGHDPQRHVIMQGADDQHRIPRAGVVGAQHHRLVGQVLPALDLHREQPQDQRPQDGPYKRVEGIFLLHTPTFLRMTSSRASSLWRKSIWLVSTITASSAGRSGAAARWTSL